MANFDQSFDQEAAPGYPVFLGSEFEHPAPEDAYFQILPVPFEASVSYGAGTASGPSAILGASWQLESWDGKSVPGRRGIYTHKPVDCSGDAETVLALISEASQAIVEKSGFPIGLGGEHTVTYGIVNGIIEAGIEDFGIVQIDAHADLRDAYEGNPYSHASVMKRIADMDIPIYQLGVRALCEEEVQARKFIILIIWMQKFWSEKIFTNLICLMIFQIKCFSQLMLMAWIHRFFLQLEHRFPVGWVGIRPWDCLSLLRNRPK